MKKAAPLFLIILPLLAFDPNQHVVPDTEHDYYNRGGYNTQGYSFPNDPQSNNYFDDPNWPNSNRSDRYNHQPSDTYYTSPNTNYQMPQQTVPPTPAGYPR